MLKLFAILALLSQPAMAQDFEAGIRGGRPSMRQGGRLREVL